LAVPAVARVGVTLDAVPDTADVLSLAAIRCSPDDILHRLESLFGALTVALLEPPFAKPGTVCSTPLPSLVKLLTNVRSASSACVLLRGLQPVCALLAAVLPARCGHRQAPCRGLAVRLSSLAGAHGIQLHPACRESYGAAHVLSYCGRCWHVAVPVQAGPHRCCFGLLDVRMVRAFV
jgi:hypothetical protein